MTTAVIDGDSLVYRCGFAVEKTFYLVMVDAGGSDDNKGWSFTAYPNAKEANKAYDAATSAGICATVWNRKELEPLDHCLATVKSSLSKILEITQATERQIFLGGKENFREQIYPEYKANRATLQKPKYYSEIRQYLIDHWDAGVVNGHEADDAVGIVGVANKDSIMVSQDKDLLQIPGRHYNWVSGVFETVTPEQGMRFFYEQVLSGDPTDNVPGLKGIGPKKAKALIEGCKTPRELAETVYKAYQFATQTNGDSLGHTPDSQVELATVEANLDLMARLVWIWRKPSDKHPLWRHLGREAT